MAWVVYDIRQCDHDGIEHADASIIITSLYAHAGMSSSKLCVYYHREMTDRRYHVICIGTSDMRTCICA